MVHNSLCLCIQVQLGEHQPSAGEDCALSYGMLSDFIKIPSCCASQCSYTVMEASGLASSRLTAAQLGKHVQGICSCTYRAQAALLRLYIRWTPEAAPAVHMCNLLVSPNWSAVPASSCELAASSQCTSRGSSEKDR